MILFFLISLFVLGTLFGSFSSVVIYRLRSGESGTLSGRSHCLKCGNTLQAQHLVPIFSWLFQCGKCAFCKEKIPVVYPLLELSSGILFMTLGYFLIDPYLILSGSGFELFRLFFFLTLGFLTLVYVWYDILFLEIPESILLIANIGVFGGLILQGYGYYIFPYLPLGGLTFEVIILSGVVIGILYTIFLAGLREIYDGLLLLLCIFLIAGYIYFSDMGVQSSALLSGTIAALIIYISFFLQIVLSGGRAMGAGDLRIAILMGLIVGVGFAFPAWMICYIIGSVIGIGVLLRQKVQKNINSVGHQIPFGPFIACGYLGVLFFAPQISQFIEWYFY
ncbi:prepilin peptidase [Candidatus Gracilibacteria bacterium]|nr:prepilin peptidase [Candidatus Gracilibacteria bacterium]